MAEQFVPGPSVSGGPAVPVQPAAPPKILPWLIVFTIGRIGIAAALVALLWLVGVGGVAGLLFGLLLAMPVSYVLLRPVRDRLTEGIAARSGRKKELRDRLRGSDTDDGAA
jgi:Protein of unknown function (DUF4229)